MITLNLTDREAYILSEILLYVGGNPEGPRKEADDIQYKLRQHKDDFEKVDMVGYDPRVSKEDVNHFLPSLYLETKESYNNLFPEDCLIKSIDCE
jgi:hypothetical protein